MSRWLFWSAAGTAFILACWFGISWRPVSIPLANPSQAAKPPGLPQEPVVPVVHASRDLPEARGPLPNLDVRSRGGAAQLPPARQEALARLEKSLPGLSVEFDPVTGSPKWIGSNSGPLTGPAAGARDPDAPVRQFIDEHRDLFGHGAGHLDSARRVTDYTTARSSSRKVVWHQELEGVEIFEAVLQANLTSDARLINVSSQFVADPEQAARQEDRTALAGNPKVSAEQAVATGGASVDERVTPATVRPAGPAAAQPDRRQPFRAAMLTDAEAKLIWVPMNPSTLRLAWDVTLSSRTRGEMYRVLVDAQTAEILVRHSMTEYISDATYRVYTTESPTPFSPGHETPSSLQPAHVERVLITTPGLNTTASPNGWINDGDNLTSGNNADAYTDTDNNNVADTPRTAGSPSRVFDFPMSLSQEPATYKDAAVTQLFYWSNFAHDRLYELGFTEAAGNFQVNNFGRGGAGNDPVRSEAQDGSGVNNANFSTPLDGGAGRMQMYNWTGPTPDRDGSFEAEVVLHEYCHGLSNRLVGGPSVSISALVSRGMGEGWSDFYGLALTAESSDNPHGNWARAGYSRYLIGSGYSENYYYGGRRYSYSTDMLKNPHTFRDIDPTQVDWHTAVPRNPTFAATQDATQVHYVGTVWATMLWDLRASLILKHGFAVGNERALFLVTEGMKLGPANPNFVQSRDGILQATLVNHPADLGEVWTAFAKRGMGDGATAPISSTTTGLTESYSVPDGLEIDDRSGWNIRGSKGGPFAPATRTLALANDGASALNWTVNSNAAWLSVSPSGGSLAPGGSVNVILTTQAAGMISGFHSTDVVFTNTSTNFKQPIAVRLYVAPPAAYTFNLDSNPGWTMSGEWAYGTPTGSGGTTSGGSGGRDPAAGATGTKVFGVNLAGNVSTTLAGPHYLTTSAVNLANHTNTRLRFQRWLNSNVLTSSRVTVEVSADGTNWREVFVNPASIITESAWTLMDYDISAIADHQSAVQVRWSYQTLNTTSPYSSWNIDDVQFLGEPNLTLGLDFPAVVSETSAPATGAVTLNLPWSSDITVALTSSDPTVATVPVSAVIPAGQVSQTFPITPVNDSLVDGTQTTVITATATGASVAARTLAVTDDEMATLSLSAPASVNEGTTGMTASVSVSVPVARDVQVLLSSNSDALTAPASVTIPAGTTGPVSFTLAAPDNALAEGPKTATLTAGVAGWTSGTAVVSILDDESPTLIVAGPTTAREGDGALQFTVTANTIQGADLMLDLSSNDVTELAVPSTVTIPAGQFTASFTATIVDDPIADGVQSVLITVSEAGYVEGTRSVTIADNDATHYTFSAVASPQIRGAPVAIDVTARDINGAVITNHSGSVNIAASSPGGPVPVAPASLSGFNNGVATGSVTLSAEVAGVTLIATDGGGRTGASNAFDVVRGPALSVTPASLALTMFATDAPASRPVTLTNPGTAANPWSATVLLQSADAEPELATVLTRINAGHAGITALVPNLYSFSEGITGSFISDGGDDMYDAGNYLGTSITTAGTNLPYSDNVIISNANLAAGGRYFTRKQPGLFVFAADIGGLDFFEITGGLGADGNGSTDTAVLTRQRQGVTYKGFVKRVYNTTDPSVNHLVIVRDNGTATQTASTDTNDDFHRLSNLTGLTRIYYLLYASNAGGYVNDTQTEAIMDAFLAAMGPADWLTLSPASGTVPAGGSANLTAFINPAGLQPGTHAATVRFASADLQAPQQDLAVALNISPPVHHFDWTVVPSPQVASQPFAATVTARTADGALAEQFNGTAHLSAQTPLTVTTSGSGTVSGGYPLVGSSTEVRTQAIYTPAEVGPAGRLLSIGLDTTSIPGAFANFTIRLKHTTKTNYSGTGNAVWETSGWTTVYRSTLAPTAAGWQTLPLTTAFDYDGTSHLMVDVSFDNTGTVTGTFSRSTSVSPSRTLVAGTSSGSAGNPLDWFSTTPTPFLNSNLANLRFSARAVAPVAPAVATFIDGHWIGALAVSKAAANISLQAVNAANPSVTGESNTFAVASIGVLTLAAPASGTEGESLNATLSVSPAPAADLVVALQSSDPSQATLPGTVIIPAGQTSAPITITLPDDGILDGPQTVVITATTGNHDAGTASVTVNDNETASLVVTLPASISEGAAIFVGGGTVSLGIAPTADLTVQLTSSDTTELILPPFVTIPAGQTAGTFNLVPVNDTLIDGNQAVTVTASLPGSTPGTRLITVTDDESRALTVSLNYTSRSEGSGTTTAAGTVSLAGTAVSSVPVTLASSDLTELQHSSTTISAGSSSASFVLTAVNDSLLDGAQTVTLTASAATFTNGARTISITDDDVHNFLVSAIPSPQVRGGSFNVTFTARDVNNSVITGYTGTPALTAGSGGSPLVLTPTTVTGFTSGAKTQSVVVQDFGSATVITLTDPLTGGSGSSNSFAVGHGSLHHFTWGAIPSPQTAAVPFSASLTARDAFENLVASYASTAQLSGLKSRNATISGTSTNSDWYPFGGYHPQNRCQMIYTPSEVGATPRRLQGLAFDMVTPSVTYPAVTLTNFTIRLKHSAKTSYNGTGNAVWESAGWTTVYQGTAQMNQTGWRQLNFTTPFDYNGTDHLMVDISSNSGTFANRVEARYSTGALRALSCFTSGAAVPTTWSGTSPTPTLNSQLPNLQLISFEAATVSPTQTTAFANGAWTGQVTVNQPGEGLQLEAAAGETTGLSNVFSVASVPLLTLALPDSAPESAGTVSGSVSITSPSGSDIVVTLTSTAPARIQPATPTVLLPAGSLSADFILNIADDSSHAGDMSVTISATATDYGAGSRAITILDNDPHHFGFQTIGVQTRGVPFAITVTAQAQDNATLTAFTGLVELSAAADGAPLPVTPAASGAFVNGVWTGSVSVSQAAPAVTLTAADAAGPTGTSNPFAVNAPPAAALLWSSQPATTAPGAAFPVILTAVDADGNPTPNFAGAASLSLANPPATSTTLGEGTFSGTVPLYATQADCRSQIIYTRAEIGPARRLTGLGLNIATASAFQYNNFTLRLRHTTRGDFNSSPAWESTGWVSVWQGNYTFGNTGWVIFTFSTPFEYNGVDNLMVDISFDNASTGTSAWLRRDPTGHAVGMIFRYGSTYGDPLAWSGTSPPILTAIERPQMRLLSDYGVSVSPAVTGAFVNGSWSGTIAIAGTHPAVVVTATGAGGVAGSSQPIQCSYAAPVLSAEPPFTGGTANSLSWTPSPGAAFYALERSGTADFAVPVSTTGLSGTTAMASGLLNGSRYYYRLRAVDGASYPASLGEWQQTSLADFTAATHANTSAQLRLHDVALAAASTSPAELVESFDGAGSTWSSTAFSTAFGNAAMGREVMTTGPNTTPPLPVNQGGDMEAYLGTSTGGENGYALTPPAEAFADGFIESYFAPQYTSGYFDASVMLRAGESGTGGIQGYAGKVSVGSSTVSFSICLLLNNVINTLGTASGSVSFVPTDNFKVRLTAQGDTLTLNVWRVSVSGGVVVESPVLLQGGNAALVRTNTTLASGRAGFHFSASAGRCYYDDVTVSKTIPSFVSSGTVTSPVIAPPWIHQWGRLTHQLDTTAPGTAASVDVLKPDGTLLAAAVANGTDLAIIPAVAAQKALRLRANLASANSAYTPLLRDWAVGYVLSPSQPLASDWSNAVSSTQDATPPTLSVEEMSVAGPTATATGTASDAVSGVGTVTVAGQAAATANGFVHWSANVPGLINGSNSVTVIARDSAVPPNTALMSTTIYRISDPNGDPNSNGLGALVEHALGIPAAAANPRSLLPATTVQIEGGQRYLTMDYRRRIQRAGLQYLIETSSDLRTWSSTGADVTEQFVTSNGDGTTETVRIRVTPAISLQGAKFVRLRVVVQ